MSPIKKMEKRSELRRTYLEILANEGNFKHNLTVLKDKQGFIVVAKRSSHGKKMNDVEDYLPCEYCKKFCKKKLLWHHVKTCKVKELFISDEFNSRGEDILQSLDSNNQKLLGENYVRRSQILLRSALRNERMTEDDDALENLFSRMHDDDISRTIQGDNLIKRFCALSLESLGDLEDQKRKDIYRVSQSGRTLARLLIESQKIKANVSLNRLIQPKNFDTVIKATKVLCFGNESLSIGSRIGHLLGHIIMVKSGLALRVGNEMWLEEANKFKTLFDVEWGRKINSVAMKKRCTMKANTIEEAPQTEDLVAFQDFLKEKLSRLICEVQESCTPQNWLSLCKATLCRVLLFNKRRITEVTDVELHHYIQRPHWISQSTNVEFLKSCSPTEAEFLKRMDMVVVRGKSLKNKDAFILLTPDSRQAIDLLNEKRSSVGVPADNRYVFARLNAKTPLSGTADLHELVLECPGIKFPSTFTSTKLRKYIATVSQVRCIFVC